MRLLWRFFVEGDFAFDSVKRGVAADAAGGRGAAGNLALRELNPAADKACSDCRFFG